MNAILGWLSMLAKGKRSKDPEHAMAVIQRNAQMQAKLIEDLLEMNKLTSGIVRLEIGAVDIWTPLSSRDAVAQPTADTKGFLWSPSGRTGAGDSPPMAAACSRFSGTCCTTRSSSRRGRTAWTLA